MVDGMTFKEYVDNEKRKWKGMDSKQKASYFKTYYLIPTLVILVVLIVLVNIILDMTVRKKIPLYTIYEVNMNGEEDSAEKLSKDFMSYLGAEGRETVYVTEQYYTEGGDLTGSTVLSTQMAAGTVDALLLDQTAYDHYASTGSYGDISLLLNSKQLEQVEDYIVKLDYSDSYVSGVYPAAIKLTGTDFAQKYFPNQEEIYLVPVVEGERIDNFAEFLKFAGLIEN